MNIQIVRATNRFDGSEEQLELKNFNTWDLAFDFLEKSTGLKMENYKDEIKSHPTTDFYNEEFIRYDGGGYSGNVHYYIEVLPEELMEEFETHITTMETEFSRGIGQGYFSE